MKYLVNRETKEHVVVIPGLTSFDSKWRIVEADAEGWVESDGTNCPLPNGCLHEVKYRNGHVEEDNFPETWNWGFGQDCRATDIIAYRPILDKPEAEPTVKESLTVDDLLDRLDAAHEAAAQIPDIIAELRERVGKHGYDLVARSPFVEQEPADDPIPAKRHIITQSVDGIITNPPSMAGLRVDDVREKGLADMSDWRNWNPQDCVECIKEEGFGKFKLGKLYRVGYADEHTVVIDGIRIANADIGFRFHSRPEQSK